MKSKIRPGDEAPKLRVLTFAEMTAVVGGQLFACVSPGCANWKTLYDVSTSTGTIFRDNGVIESFVNGKYVGGTSPAATKPPA